MPTIVSYTQQRELPLLERDVSRPSINLLDQSIVGMDHKLTLSSFVGREVGFQGNSQLRAYC